GLVVMKDGPARQSAVVALVAAGAQVIVAENLAAASASFFLHEVSIVVIDASVHGGRWVDAGESLGLGGRGTPVWLAADPSPPIEEIPGWATAIPTDRLETGLVRRMLGGASTQKAL